MTNSFRLTLAQLNPTVGDLHGNADKAHAAFRQAAEARAHTLALPEMFITGYQVQDLVLKPAFTRDAMAHVAALAERCAGGPAVCVGGPLLEDGVLYNAYFVLRGGKIASVARKHHLPNYGVFDEVRHYTPGRFSGPFEAEAVRLGTPICEDTWHDDVAETMVESGAEILIVPNGSPYHRGKLDLRMNHMVARVVENDVPLAYLNMVGGQDDQVFDGGSFVLNRGGKLAAMLPVFDEAVETVEFRGGPEGWTAEPGVQAAHPPAIEQDYRVMVEALRDYLGKAGFDRVLLGLSGGVDSALVATIAADALGPDRVRCVMLPSEYTSGHSLEDAAGVAHALGCRLDNLPIGPARAAVTDTLAPLFNGADAGVAEENVQSRLRGLLLMALSNKFGEMLLTTGNKSEVAVGYATIYGDMAGGYNPIKDLYKTRVFDTCRWRNEHHRDWMKGPAGVVIPPRVIDKPPSAELRADQKDEDSLPPYPVLDGILELLIDQDASVADCVEAGFDLPTVKRVEQLIYISEYKRFQSAPGARLTPRAFWLDRRYPIVNRWRDGG
ncbi:MAG: NAD+ synthase [Pseudomonadota bacterium]